MGVFVKTVTKFPISLLNICIVSLMLSACGGGGSDDGYYGSESGTGSNQVPDNDSSKLPDANPGVDSAYPEPKLDVLDASALGFYDHDGRAGEARVLAPI